MGYSDVPRLLLWWAATVCPSCFCLFPHLEKVFGVRLSSVVERLPSFFVTLGSVTSIPHACNLSTQQNEVVAPWIQSQYGMYISDPIPVPLPSIPTACLSCLYPYLTRTIFKGRSLWFNLTVSVLKKYNFQYILNLVVRTLSIFCFFQYQGLNLRPICAGQVLCHWTTLCLGSRNAFQSQVAPVCNSSTWEAKAGGVLWIHGHH